jgi:hypothetical protein
MPHTGGMGSLARTVCTGAAIGLLLGSATGILFGDPLRAALSPWLNPVQSVIFARSPPPIVVVPVPTFSASPITVTPTITAGPVSPPSPQAPRTGHDPVRRAAAGPPPASRNLGGSVKRGPTVTVTQTSQAPRTTDQVRSAAAGPPSASQRTVTQRVTATVTETPTSSSSATTSEPTTTETTTSETATESSAALREVGLEGPG